MKNISRQKNIQTHSNKLWYCLIISAIFFFNSCANYYYAPNDSNLLAISEPGELKVSGAISPVINDKAIDNARIYSLQAGYSPLKHLVLNANYFNAKMARSPEANNLNYLSGSGSIFEGALGGYIKINKLKDKQTSLLSREVFLDAYIGSGRGTVTNYFTSGGQSVLSFRKNYIQFGVHTKWKIDKIQLGSSIGLRAIQLDFDKISYNGIMTNAALNDISYLQTNEPFSLFEASYRFHMGLRQFSLFFSGTIVRSKLEFDYISSIAQVGAVVNIDEFFNKKRYIRFQKKKTVDDTSE